MSPAREERALLPGSDSRPADVFLPSYHNGLDCAVDVTIVSPLQKALIARSSEVAGSALTHAFDRKMRQNYDNCNREGIHFVAAPVETFGGFHSQSIAIVSKIGRQLARHTGRLESEVISHLYQRLGILLTKGNSALILSCFIESSSSPDVNGDVDHS